MLRRSDQRGFANHGWLQSHHSFSFADYYDPKNMGFRDLRVINEDHIEGGTGFGMHPHRDMEIITYVIRGALEHKDSMGNKETIRPGEVQRMSAGTGVLHSEYNAQADEEVHLLQIWILPKTHGGSPGYEQKSFGKELDTKKMTLVVSQDGREGSIGINQDVDLYISRLRSGDSTEFQLRPNRGVWIQLIKGQLEVSGQTVSAGDAMTFEEAELIQLKSLENSEFMLFDLV